MTDTPIVDAITGDPPLPTGMATAAVPSRLYLTSDVRAVTGLSRTHLDYYIRERLIRPAARTESGFLLFDDAEVALLRDIVEQRRAGVPLRQIRQAIGR